MSDPELPAIPARHSRVAEELIYRALVRWPLWSSFDRIWLKIDGPLPHPADGPLICVMNHPSWWDGYVALLLHRAVFRRTFQNFLMMDERQLKRFVFFSWIGVFSVSLTDGRAAARSVAYAARQLRERRDRCLWIFPQGKLTPNDQRPIQVHSGVARIAIGAGGATMWPVAVRYEFRNEQRPELFIRCGPPRRAEADAGRAALASEIQSSLTAAADSLRDDVLHERLDGYRTLMRGRPGINRVGDALFAALRPRRRS